MSVDSKTHQESQETSAKATSQVKACSLLAGAQRRAQQAKLAGP
eukprot:CAMPEP_0113728822 /NCGR_PEP_ID=MMETSP0038_2-20120614/42148_1 /TAXON_ID=2898 /ORGANISM="Cryptomonas paramecium" /LENGTH=43 /DNA_ID=CAMNT_0000660477 /DNA_START=147 /DNA_END=275 /DNA_ORIENTATION=+ /assembly_acc=CAM_ASM_000170